MSQTEVATLGGGCFWCLEAVFDEMEGVLSVESGYAGGDTLNPAYQDICGGRTGHAEVVRVTFDPAVAPYRELLEVFFAIHDPTTFNRQGNDVGTQYRSVIFHHSDEQERVARELIRQIDEGGLWSNPVVTQVSPVPEFYMAEDHHQEYFQHNGYQPYCLFVVGPKLKKFRDKFFAKRKKSA